MKTEQTIKAALTKYSTELEDIKTKIHDTEVWKEASLNMKHVDLFIAQREELKDLRAKEKEADFKIRFVKWILEN